MIDLSQKEIWFLTGSQHLYGPKTLAQVAENSQKIVDGLNESSQIPVKIIYKPTVKTPHEITDTCIEANSTKNCIGVITWMHTFSPAKMWINGLNNLNKPICHLHTQFSPEIPWNEIDMDYMNLHQSAHGDREYGFMMTRLRKKRKIVVGHWKDQEVQRQIGVWARVTLGWNELQNMKVARIGDNMREVAVTEGDKVEAQMRFGMSVNAYDSSDVQKYIDKITEDELQALLKEYEQEYEVDAALLEGGEMRNSLVESAKLEIGLKKFLENGGFTAYTDTFENLGDWKQLPGIASQRLMAQGYGFGAEGDWKTAALVRAFKVMQVGMDAGTSFMEDYTYHITPEKSYVLGAHMLEVCPSISAEKPKLEVHKLGIGGKEAPARLVFTGKPGKAINASLIDMGNRFRLVVNEVETVEPLADLPKLPVASVLWEPMPNLKIGANAWILAGGAHHSIYSQAVTTEFMEIFADIAGIELLVIDENTNIREFKDKINSNEVYYHLFQHRM